ncbi:hypothetical protein SPLC1_S190030 [Arthrospira platensis C1]|nr:hypothetical protein SPLC1_S190030 [Arthrospira platensis C1]
MANSFPVSKSHSFRVLSLDAETARFPSGAIATAHTEPLCPVRVASSVPVSKSHSFRVLSSDAETARFPSGAIATAFTQRLCPVRVASSVPVSKSHSFRVSSRMPRPLVSRRGRSLLPLPSHYAR